MTVQTASFENFRNLSKLTWSPDEGINVIYGANAQGKTNLLEALWLFTGCKSFRGAKEAELLRFGEAYARLSLEFRDSTREKRAELHLGEKKAVLLNGVSQGSTGKLIGQFNAVVFSPVHLSLVQAGPVCRRRFLDTALCQLKPKYAEYFASFRKALMQRNALLKDVAYHAELLDVLDDWDKAFARYAGELLYARMRYIRLLSEYSAGIYGGISEKKEKLSLSYESSVPLSPEMSAAECSSAVLIRLAAQRKDDIFLKTTVAGPHRDDLEIQIDTLSARSYGSQGQQRSAALSLKLGEAEIIREVTGETPVALLDDVMSELDEKRQDYILNHIEGKQVFLTCCDPSQVLRLTGGKAFHMQNGILTEDS